MTRYRESLAEIEELEERRLRAERERVMDLEGGGDSPGERKSGSPTAVDRSGNKKAGDDTKSTAGLFE
jgi:hypothetical protein